MEYIESLQPINRIVGVLQDKKGSNFNADFIADARHYLKSHHDIDIAKVS